MFNSDLDNIKRAAPTVCFSVKAALFYAVYCYFLILLILLQLQSCYACAFNCCF